MDIHEQVSRHNHTYAPSHSFTMDLGADFVVVFMCACIAFFVHYEARRSAARSSDSPPGPGDVTRGEQSLSPVVAEVVPVVEDAACTPVPPVAPATPRAPSGDEEEPPAYTEVAKSEKEPRAT